MSLLSGFVTTTAPPEHPNSRLGWQGLHGARADTELGSLAMEVVAKNRRRVMSRAKSFSSLETND